MKGFPLQPVGKDLGVCSKGVLKQPLKNAHVGPIHADACICTEICSPSQIQYTHAGDTYIHICMYWWMHVQTYAYSPKTTCNISGNMWFHHNEFLSEDNTHKHTATTQKPRAQLGQGMFLQFLGLFRSCKKIKLVTLGKIWYFPNEGYVGSR